MSLLLSSLGCAQGGAPWIEEDLEDDSPTLDASSPSSDETGSKTDEPKAVTPTIDGWGSAGDGGATGSLKPKCVKKPSQVMIIGDSYINWITHTFGADLATASGQKWRMEAIGAYSMGSGGLGLIPSQYHASIKKDPDCHTVLMDGGGNDMLIADPSLDLWRDCLTAKSTTLPQCQTIIDKALRAAEELLAKATADGVRDVVYFFYPHIPVGTLLGGPSPNIILDFAAPQIRKFCDGIETKTAGKTRCTFVDMVPVFEGHADWFVPGDVHPTSMGSAAMAKKIWGVMKDNCIGQPTGSGCCEE